MINGDDDIDYHPSMTMMTINFTGWLGAYEGGWLVQSGHRTVCHRMCTLGPLGDWVEELAALAFCAACLLSAVALQRCSAEKVPLLIRLCHDVRFKVRSSQALTGISKLLGWSCGCLWSGAWVIQLYSFLLPVRRTGAPWGYAGHWCAWHVQPILPVPSLRECLCWACWRGRGSLCRGFVPDTWFYQLAKTGCVEAVQLS